MFVINLFEYVNKQNTESLAPSYNWCNPNYEAERYNSHFPTDRSNKDNRPLDILKADEGFEIISYSKNWTGQNLKAIYAEVLNNKHGIEIEYLDSIIIYPGAPPSNLAGAWGCYNSIIEDIEYAINFPTISNDLLKYSYPLEKGQICLYYGDKINHVSEMARTLSHEYGHHYTFHHFNKPCDTDPSKTFWDIYYELRGLDAYPQVKKDIDVSNGQEYRDQHMWFLHEIAAEDYWQLMGSSEYKSVKEYIDIEMALKKYIVDSTYKWDVDFDNNTINVYPQENYIIPLAYEIEGLNSFFSSFIDNGYKDTDSINVSKPKLTYKKVQKRDHTYYQFEWTECSADDDALYTLVALDYGDNILYPIKTVTGKESKSAKIGKVAIDTADGTWYWDDNIGRGKKCFRVYVIFNDGHMVSSDPLYIDFD